MKQENDNSDDKRTDNYLAYSISAGLLIGTVISVVTSCNIGICAGMGMLLGVVVGSIIDHKVKNTQ